MSASWADYWEALLSICKSAVACEQLRMAAFFFPVDQMNEYVLGPHWLADSFDKAPFIRASMDSDPWRQIHGSSSGMLYQNKKLNLYRLSDDLLFCTMENGADADDDAAATAVAGSPRQGDFLDCWNNLCAFIPRDAPDLNPE